MKPFAPRALFTRLTALLLTASLTLTPALCAGAGASASTTTVTITDNSRFVNTISANAAGPQQSYALEFTPGGTVFPVVYTGRILGATSMSDAAAALEAQGYYVIGGINGDFFSSNGIPLGLVIEDGELITADCTGGSANYAICFREDGSAFVATSGVTMTLTNHGPGDATGETTEGTSGGTTEGTSGGTTEETTGGTTEESGDATGESTDSTTGESTGGTTGESTGGTTGESTDNTTENSSGDTTENPTGDTTENPAEESTGGTTEESSGGAEGDTSGDATEPPTEPPIDPPTEGETASQPTVVTVNYYNRLRHNWGSYLLSPHFYDTNGAAVHGKDVLFEVVSGEVSVNGTAELRVAATYEGNTPTAIPEGHLLYTVNQNAPNYADADLFAVGDLVTLAVTCEDPALGEAVWATGGGDLLIKEGAITDSAGWDTAITGRNPRTAVGVKADGTVVLYAIDGRSPDHSNGLTLAQLADELRSQGCVTALNLDGGGSTTMMFRSPTDDSLSIINSPSDGTPRSCGTYIFLVSRRADATGKAANLYVDEERVVTLPLGASADLSALITARDACYQPAALPDDLTYAVAEGVCQVDENGVLTATGYGPVVVAAFSMELQSVVLLNADVPAQSALLENFEGENTLLEETYLTTSHSQVKFGLASAALPFTLEAGATAFYPFQASLDFAAMPESIALWACAEGGAVGLNALFASATGETFTVPFGIVASQDWQLYAADTDELLRGCSLLGLEVINGAAETVEGVLYLDQLHVPGEEEDIAAPEITLQVEDGLVTALLMDDSGLVFTEGLLSLTLDGEPLPFLLSDNELTAQLPEEDGAARRLTLTVSDHTGRLARASADLPAAEASYPFTDVPAGHWAADAVSYLYARGVVGGVDEGLYDPSSPMTRAAFCTILSRTLGLDTDVQYELDFIDLADIPEWALPHVRAMVAAGYIDGRPEDGGYAFAPNDSITRAELFTLLSRFAPKGYELNAPLDFADLDAVADWALDGVTAMAAMGLVTGYEDDTIRAQNPVSRAEVALLLYRFL